jgi:hypothetical protein
MLRMSVYMHSRFIENHPIRILEDGPLISEVVLSQVDTNLEHHPPLRAVLPFTRKVVGRSTRRSSTPSVFTEKKSSP